jgi:hypothetical protein
MVEENAPIGTMFQKFLNDPDLNNLFERIKLQIRIDQERAKAEQESLPKQQE